jgi:hypothetical protein
MIPEIMRVFNETKDGISKNLFDRWNEKLIKPLKKEFMKDANGWEKFIENKQAFSILIVFVLVFVFVYGLTAVFNWLYPVELVY